jgi:hypothetical protein
VVEPCEQRTAPRELDVQHRLPRQPPRAPPGRAAVGAEPHPGPHRPGGEQAAVHGQRAHVPAPLPATPERRPVGPAVARAAQLVARRDVERGGIARIDLEDVEALEAQPHPRPRGAAVRAPEDGAGGLGVDDVRARRRDRQPVRLPRLPLAAQPRPGRSVPAVDAFEGGQVQHPRARRIDVDVVDRAAGRVWQRRPRRSGVGADEDPRRRVRLQVEGRGLRRRQLQRQHQRVGRQTPTRAPPRCPAVRALEHPSAVRPRIEDRRTRRVDLQRRDGSAERPARTPAADARRRAPTMPASAAAAKSNTTRRAATLSFFPGRASHTPGHSLRTRFGMTLRWRGAFRRLKASFRNEFEPTRPRSSQPKEWSARSATSAPG